MRNTSPGGKSDPQLEADVRHLRELIVAASRQAPLRDPIAGMCEEAQLTPPQVHAVMWLGLDGPLTMGELARRVGVTEKTITGIVDRLEAAGYLARERDLEDRRVVRARLTARGTDIHRELDGHVARKVTALMRLLDPADRKSLFRILEKLVRRPAAAGAAPEKKP